MVPIHSAYPLTDGCAGLGHFSYGGWFELLIFYVCLQHFYHRIWDIVLRKNAKVYRINISLSQLSDLLFPIQESSEVTVFMQSKKNL